MNSIADTVEFYESLASLFYAIAMADNRARVAEKKAIVRLVEEEWSMVNDTLDSQEVVYERLKGLFDNKHNKEEAFLDFKRFYLRNAGEFSEELKKKIMHAVNEIADAFAGRNKSESVLASRLYFLMWK